MIALLRRADCEQRKLFFSLGINFMTRIPGLIGVLWFLPLLRFGLGTDDYANLLTAIALGTAPGFLFAGFGLVGRRLIGEAYADGHRIGEANGFISLLLASAVALVIALAFIISYCWMRHTGWAVLVIAALAAISLFVNASDHVRAAYNEHYVTATLLIVFQASLYAIGFLVPAFQQNLILGSLVLQSHYMLASFATLALLLRGRWYLLSGRATATWPIVCEGIQLAMADGFLMATLSLGVVWLQASTSATTAAWFATTVRLFQTFLVPVVLLLMPLSSYIRILWTKKSIVQQQAFTKAVLVIGLGYGAIVASGLLIASRIYVGALLHLSEPGGLLHVIPCFLLFGAIVAYRSYSSVAYLVLDETAHLSSWTTGVVSAAAVLGVTASFILDPLNALNVYALAAGLSMTMVLFWNAARFIRLSPSAPGV